MKRVLLICVLLLGASSLVMAAGGVKKKRPRAYDYGKVEINNFSTAKGLSPAVFNHWTHRDKYTCRICHVDIAFEMQANATEITADDNLQGYYCGTCHDGKMTYAGKAIFDACDPAAGKEDRQRCTSCHQPQRPADFKNAFYDFKKQMPRDRAGNKVDWEKAEEAQTIQPIDYIEGLSPVQGNLPVQEDFALNASLEGMPAIIFSHRKHTEWNGCETCHPEIFVGVKRGATKYSMVDIFAGKYCGVCHGTVAFPLQECQRCHTEPVQ